MQYSGLKVNNLSYTYDHTPLFSGVTFDVPAGSALQVVGKNGQGKTTLLRVIAGLLPSLEGQIIWDGDCIQKQPDLYRRHLTYVGHKLALKPYLTVQENLLLFARLMGHAVEADHLKSICRQVGLGGQLGDLTYQLSAGQRQRLALARLQVWPTRLWILDEPLSALCEEGQHTIKAWMTAHLSGGGHMIFTSHYPIHLSDVVRTWALL